MDKQPSGREDYVRKVLEAYRNTPGTCGNLRRPDRMLAVQLYQRGVPLSQSRERTRAGRGSPLDPASRCSAADHRALSGLLPAGHRGSP